MDDVLTVAVVECHEDHLESFGSKLLIEILVLHYAVEQLSTFAKLCDEINIGLFFKVFVELDDVRVILIK